MRARKRRQSVASDSFDLFLDTITNTFGGILLVALLMVLLIRETSQIETDGKEPENSTSAELVQKIEQLNATRANLLESLRISQEFSSKFEDPESRNLADQISKLAIQEQNISNRADLQRDKMQSLNDQLVSSEQQVEQLKNEVELARQAMEENQKKLKAEKTLRTRTMALPKESVTNKRMTIALVKNDRLYIVDKSRGRLAFEINSNQFAPSTESQADVVLANGDSFEVKTDSGIDLRIDKLVSELDQFDSNSFVVFAVWPDSFQRFKNIRETCVNCGLEYKVFPLAKGPVVETRSAARAKSQ